MKASPARYLFCALLPLLLAACGEQSPVRTFAPDAYPALLSEWGILARTETHLVLGPDVEPYDINTPLFTDYAQKLRTLWMPQGSAAVFSEDDGFEFPVGTILSKTFFYPREPETGRALTEYQWSPHRDLPLADIQLMETRLLVRTLEGWDALPYVWEGSDARLKIAGSLSRLELVHSDGKAETLPYIVPTRNECAACHATDHSSGALEPIGLKARHLNRAYLGIGTNQLTAWQADGRLRDLPPLSAVARNADWSDSTANVRDRARAYLDANCGHCHNPKGAADTSGLMLDAATTSQRALGLCKPPIAAGQGTGGHAYSIVPGQPEHSILVFRMASTDLGSRMPELGRTLAHTEGVELISDWISSISGECVAMSAD